ncbi:hypothetical protein SAMN02745129_0897 [Ferrimonas marina]|uniref:Uncharacterized protein n=1 Tax=Ferrimonas marina TaxID=299255 RepID=A0A1M5N4T7_9GAMM|nr:hypothetical protein SAMN02745129_0897 [Ferrimonas marina]
MAEQSVYQRGRSEYIRLHRLTKPSFVIPLTLLLFLIRIETAPPQLMRAALHRVLVGYLGLTVAKAAQCDEAKRHF